MTTTFETRHAMTPKPPVHRGPFRGRVVTAVVLVISLICSGIMRQVAADRQAVMVNIRGSAAGRSALGNMDSFALALLLGGLRGPLVMILWPAIENQKVDHNLEDVDTMIEWVRLLQPEFDTVHMFQIWNKAYNVSVLMSSPANKYAVIMESLDYAESVDRERPGDINILNAMSNVYAGKLGSLNLPEFPFYSRQFREESMTDARRKVAYASDLQFTRISKWKPLLDGNNEIRPDLLVVTRPRPADVPAGSEWNDGSELQYLKQYSPFPTGISALAMSYNYAKRAEVAQSVEGQKALQVSEMVIDSQPALQMKFWEEDDTRRGRAAEAAAFGVPRGHNALEAEAVLAAISPHAVYVDRTAFDAALYYYSNAARVCRDAIPEYQRHIRKPAFAMRQPIYLPHIAELQGNELLDSADHGYLLASVTTDPQVRRQILATAKTNYNAAAIRLQRTALEYYTEDGALFATGASIPGGGVLPPPRPGELPADHQRIFDLADSQVSDVFDKAMTVAAPMPDHKQDRQEYSLAVARCRLRAKLIDDELAVLRK